MTGTEAIILLLTLAVGLFAYLTKVSYDLHHPPEHRRPRRRK